jgi:hypothetical protein
LTRKLKSQSEAQAQKLAKLSYFSEFVRAKTVFCHANMQTDEVSTIYNVNFDQAGKFIVSAGDEG